MQTSIAAFLRHFITFLAGLGGLLVTYGLVTPTDAAAVDSAGESLIEPLTIVGGAIAAGLSRLLMGWLGFSGDNNFPDDDEPTGKNGYTGGRLPGWVLLAGMVGAFGFSPPSCSPPGTVPIHASYHKDGLTVGYDSKGGLSVDQESGK